MSGVIADQIYGHLDQQKLLPEKQKGCRKRSRRTNDLLDIDRAVIREVKSRKKNLAMAWIDYKKAYDMVPHSWIKKYIEFFGVAENIAGLPQKNLTENPGLSRTLFLIFQTCFINSRTFLGFFKKY